MSTKRRTEHERLALVEQIKELTASGHCSREIEHILDIPRKYVQKLYLKYNIPHVKRGGAYGKWNGSYNGGRIVDKNGYIYILCREHPHANSSGYVFEHRLVMEQKLGRYLEPHEVVHHLNDDKQDNRPENLELFSSNTEHLRKTLKGKCPNWYDEGYQKMKDAAQRKHDAALQRAAQQTSIHAQ